MGRESAWIGVALFLGGLWTSGVGAQSTDIIVSPDVPVSRSSRPHVEYDVATDPSDPGRLVVAGFSLGPDGTSVWVSADGGTGWTPVHLPEQAERGGADPQVAFLGPGEAMLVALSTEPGQVGRPRNDLSVFRSDDGGRRWEESVRLDGASYDRPVLATSPTAGGEPGVAQLLVRIPPEGRIALLRSTDGGRSFTDPVTVAQSSSQAIQTFGLEVLPSGTTVIPYLVSTPEGQTLRVTTTEDGRSFGDPVEVVTVGPDSAAASRRQERGTPIPSGGWALSSGPSGGTVYLGWRADTPEGSRVFLSRSDDGGRTWSEPSRVSGGTGEHGSVMLAVNRDGTVGVAWVASDVTGDEWTVEAWFTASTDGGRSFATPRRLNSVPTAPRTPGNRAAASVRVLRLDSTTLVPITVTALGRFPTGGDYLGMTADAAGRFHPVWADARTGEYQPWTAAVTVGGSIPAVPPGLDEPEVLEDMDLLVDAVRTRGDSAEVWVRLKNRGDTPVWPPLRLTGAPGRSRGVDGPSAGPPAVDFSHAVGDLGMIPPGGVSQALRWVLPLEPDGSFVGSPRLRVTGRRAKLP